MDSIKHRNSIVFRMVRRLQMKKKGSTDMKKYTVERELQDLFDVGTKIYQTRHALQSIIYEIYSSTDKIKDSMPVEDRARINSSVSSLWVIVDELENINEMVEALDAEDSRNRHIAFIKEALFTPAEQRTYLQNKGLAERGLEDCGFFINTGI